jgi:hypothetical protein
VRNFRGAVLLWGALGVPRWKCALAPEPYARFQYPFHKTY